MKHFQPINSYSYLDVLIYRRKFYPIFSLSERFGLWLSFYPPKQDEYLAIVAHWLEHFGLSASAIEAARPEALVWALERGSRSGRVAWQFAKHWAGSRA